MSNILRAVIMMKGTSVHASRRSDACGHCDLYVHCEDLPDCSAFTDGGEGLATMAQLILKPDWLLRNSALKCAGDHAAPDLCSLLY